MPTLNLSSLEMLNVKGKDKGCVRREAGSEKREWQEARGDQAAHQTTTQLTHQRCAANTDMKTDTNTNTAKIQIKDIYKCKGGRCGSTPLTTQLKDVLLRDQAGWLVGRLIRKH